MNRELYQELLEKMKICMEFRKTDAAHDSQHVLRVVYLAAAIGKNYPVDQDVLLCAAILHDIGRAYERDGQGEKLSHATIGGNMAYTYLLRLGWAEKKAAHVRDCIYTHSLKKGVTPASIEGQILFDSDKVDLMGVMGIARTLQAGAVMGEPLYCLDSKGKIDPKNEKDPSYIKQHLTRLAKTLDQLYTPEAKKIAGDRLSIMEKFYEEMIRETEDLFYLGSDALDKYFFS